MMKKLDLPRDEMAIRKIYKKLVEQGKLTTVFRPGKRLCGDFRGYCPGEEIKLRIIDKTGADWAMLPPEFISDFIKLIEIENIEALPLGKLESKHFVGSSPDVQSKDDLIYQLGIIYNLELENLHDEALVTRITFKYKDC